MFWGTEAFSRENLCPCRAVTLERFAFTLPASGLEASERDSTSICWFAEGWPVGMEDCLLKYTISSGPHDTLQCRKTLPVGSGT